MTRQLLLNLIRRHMLAAHDKHNPAARRQVALQIHHELSRSFGQVRVSGNVPSKQQLAAFVDGSLEWQAQRSVLTAVRADSGPLSQLIELMFGPGGQAGLRSASSNVSAVNVNRDRATDLSHAKLPKTLGADEREVRFVDRRTRMFDRVMDAAQTAGREQHIDRKTPRDGLPGIASPAHASASQKDECAPLQDRVAEGHGLGLQRVEGMQGKTHWARWMWGCGLAAGVGYLMAIALNLL